MFQFHHMLYHSQFCSSSDCQKHTVVLNLRSTTPIIANLCKNSFLIRVILCNVFVLYDFFLHVVCLLAHQDPREKCLLWEASWKRIMGGHRMSDEAKESRSRSLDRLPYGDQSDDAIHVRLVSLHRYVVRYEMIMEYTDCTHVVYFFTHATITVQFLLYTNIKEK